MKKHIFGAMALAMLLVGALIAPATADSHTADVDINDSHIGAQAATFSSQEDVCASIPSDQDGWHFVVPGNASFLSLTVEFEDAGVIVLGDGDFGPPSAQHAYIGTAVGDTLVSGSATITGWNSAEAPTFFNLSHTCPGEESEDPEDPEEPETPTVSIEFLKTWEGEDEGDAVAKLVVSYDGEEIATLAPGQTLDVTEYAGETLDLEEIVEDLSEECEYTSNLDDSIDIPEIEEGQVEIQAAHGDWKKRYKDKKGDEEPEVEHLTLEISVTNNVECETETTEVESETTEKKEEPTSTVQVLEEQLEADDDVEEDEETLPRTGVPALLLALLGLTAIGSGGAILRRR